MAPTTRYTLGHKIGRGWQYTSYTASDEVWNQTILTEARQPMLATASSARLAAAALLRFPADAHLFSTGRKGAKA